MQNEKIHLFLSLMRGKFINIIIIIKEAIVSLKSGDFLKQHSLLRKHGLSARYFDADTYKNTYPDVRNCSISPFEHFMTIGLQKGYEGYFFDCNSYLEYNPDVKQSGINAFTHYKYFRKNEFRDFNQIKISMRDGISRRRDYTNWRNQNKNLLELSLQIQNEAMAQFIFKPKISIIMPVYNTNPAYLKEAIASVKAQTYDNWELCIADDASTIDATREVINHFAADDTRIKIIFREINGHISMASNSALKLATGQYVAFLDHDDTLSSDALFWVVNAINHNPDLNMIYSDEDKINYKGEYFDPYFKPDFSYDLFLSQNYICHFAVYRHDLVKNSGGFRKGYEGAQDYDLALRILPKCNKHSIIHIPRILYHWRAIQGSTSLTIDEKPYAIQSGINAIDDYCQTNGIKAQTFEAPEKAGNYRIKYKITDNPLISIIIPTRDRADLLKKCIDSIINHTTYKNYEIIIVDNGSVEAETRDYFKTISAQGIQIITQNIVFNYSKLNNSAVQLAKGEIIVFLNNDIEIISHDWIQEMLGHALQEGVGAVGARLWYPDNTIQHAGVIMGINGAADHINKNLPRGNDGYFGRAVLQQNFSAMTAACLMMRKDTFYEVGQFDEIFAIDFNDIDLCLRLNEKGYRNVYTPYAEMYHHESATRGKAKNPKELSEFIRKWKHFIKNDPFHNPNLSLDDTDFSYAFPPRQSLYNTIFKPEGGINGNM